MQQQLEQAKLQEAVRCGAQQGSGLSAQGSGGMIGGGGSCVGAALPVGLGTGSGSQPPTKGGERRRRRKSFGA